MYVFSTDHLPALNILLHHGIQSLYSNIYNLLYISHPIRKQTLKWFRAIEKTFILDIVCCSRMKLGGVRLRFPKWIDSIPPCYLTKPGSFRVNKWKYKIGFSYLYELQKRLIICNFTLVFFLKRIYQFTKLFLVWILECQRTVPTFSKIKPKWCLKW